MKTDLATIAANMRKAAWNRQHVEIAGGVFTPIELSEAAVALKAFPAMLECLELAVLRVKLANSEGDPILSAWLPDAIAALEQAKKEKA